jgi:hypothetical protein
MAHSPKSLPPTAATPMRYATPSFQSAPPGAGAPPAAGHKQLADWSKEQLGPVPPPINEGNIDLSAIIGPAGVHEIEQLGEIRFHVLGDSGAGHADEAEEVAEEMATDFKPGAGGLNPAFLFHLGDVLYGPSKADHYGERFYRPYSHYPGKIIAIPGNHDGEAKIQADQPSLSAFRANFCTTVAVVPQQAAGSGIYRQTMTLPGVYWCLDAPFVRIIGLYSNLLENPGFLEGKTTTGQPDSSQLAWLASTLNAIAAANDGKALIIATHHPPYSSAGHSGSDEMRDSIDAVCERTGVVPNAFFSGHAHNYQRYTRRLNGKPVPYFVVGTGGMPPQKVPAATGQPVDGHNDVTYDKAVASLGYGFVTVKRDILTVEFWEKGDQHTTPFDVVDVKL